MLDARIELNRSMNGTLESMARALFKDWFVDFGPTRAKQEGMEPYLAPELWSLFPERLDAEGKPDGWTDQPLSMFFSVIGGGTPKTSVDVYWGGDIPWFSVVDTPSPGSVFVLTTEKKITQKGLDESAARLVQEGTTIISARGTVGNLAMAGQPMTFNQSCYGLRGEGDVGDCFVFLAAQYMVGRLQAMAHGSVFSTITRQTFDAVTLTLASSKVLKAFDEATQLLFRRIKANVAVSRTLAQTRDLLLPKLISGVLRVREAERLVEAAV
jgi:type I restriction enzyme S subunit